MFAIDKLKLSSPLILAPMSGITSFPFRMLNRHFGCELAFVEMIDAHSLYYGNTKTREMLYMHPDDRPLGIQLLGNEPQVLLRCLEKIQNLKFDVLDFNAACPQKKVTNKNKGAALLKTPKKLYHLLKLIVKHAHAPVTVKMRLGWDNSRTAQDIALYAQEAGISAVFVHGRTRAQYYSGQVDYQAIKKIKDALTIPIIASGDIFTPSLAKKMFDETGCDAVLIARGALGNPWIFKAAQQFLKNATSSPKPSLDDITDVMKMHFKLCLDFFGEKRSVIRFRKFFIWYTRGFKNVKPLRAELAAVRTKEEMFDVIEAFGSLNQL